MKNIFRKEIQAFDVFDKNGKRLIMVNMMFAMVFPFIVLFSTAFLNRTTGNPVIPIINGFGFSIGLVLSSFINGKLLRRKVDIRYLFAIGLFLSIASTFVMMMFAKPSIGFYIIFFGFFSGAGGGFYWSNRQFLSFLVTNEENRNFFASLDQFFKIFFESLIPFLFGTIIIMLGRKTGWYDEIFAYQAVAGILVVLMTYAVILVLKSSFKSPVINKFIYKKFNRIWNTHRLLVLLFGFLQSGIMYFLPLLILNIAGDETVLGKIELSTAIFSVITIYILGRITTPKHRAKMMFFGAVLFTLGGIVLTFTINNDQLFQGIVKISFLGVIFMKITQVIAQPLVNTAFASTSMSDIGKSSAIEQRDSYTYIFDNELFMNIGRSIGGILFIALNYLISPTGALQYIFIIIGLFQIISAVLIKKLTNINIDFEKHIYQQRLGSDQNRLGSVVGW